MRHVFTVLVCALFVLPAVQAETYRWVDDNGVVHYSDSPNPASSNPDGDKIKLRQPNVIPSRVPVARSTPARATRDSEPEQEEEQDSAAVGYTSIKVVSPVADETLWNIGGRLTVNLQLTPRLAPGHGIAILLDGKQVTARPVAATSITLNEIYRGQHSLRAVVRDSNGKDLIGSSPVTFFVQQTSVAR